MVSYIAKRLLAAIPTLLGVSMAVFFIMHVLPGDAVDMMVAQSGATAQRMAELRHELGLDQPVHVQYWTFLRKALQGDLGRGVFTRVPVTRLILEQLPDTLQLAFAGLFVAIVLGVALGLLSAIFHNSWIDVVATLYSTLGISMPLFWFGLIAILVFSLRLHWIPAAGSGTFKQLIAPATVLGMGSAAVIARLVRSSMLEVMRQEYMVTARAKGLAERIVLIRHGLRNALIPVVTIIGLQFSGLLGGAVITETVFSRRGLGSLAVGAVMGKDFQLVQGCVLFAATGYVLMNLIVDLVYGSLIPASGTIDGRPAKETNTMAEFQQAGSGFSDLRSQGASLSRFFRELRRSPSASLGAFVVVLLVLMAILADQLAPYGPNDVTPLDAMQSPNAQHLLGTDPLGRDLLSRILFGSRLSLRLGLISTSIAAVVGSMLGLLAGYYRGKVEAIIMSFVDILLAFPSILLALAIIFALGINMTNLMLAVGISGIPGYVRVVRGTVLGIKAAPYLEAARVIGCSDSRMIARHILPNTFAPIIVLATMGVASAILTGSSLSFLGLGTKPPTPEWGVMLAEGRGFMALAPWITTFPGLAIMVTVLGMNLLGNGLRDILDPRLRAR